MPITNQFLKVVSSIDPWCRQHAYSLKFMHQLPEIVQNVLSSEEKEKFDLEVRRYHVDSVPQPKDKGDVDS